MERLLKTLKDEGGRQIEGMIILVLIGISLAIGIPWIRSAWEKYSWWSLLAIPAAIVVVFLGILFLVFICFMVDKMFSRGNGNRRQQDESQNGSDLEP